jgi:hypothetical protein
VSREIPKVVKLVPKSEQEEAVEPDAEIIRALELALESAKAGTTTGLVLVADEGEHYASVIMVYSDHFGMMGMLNQNIIRISQIAEQSMIWEADGE